MVKNKIKNTGADKKLLKFLVEDFLEFDQQELLARIDGKEKIDDYWEKLLPFLKRETYRQENPDQEEIDNSNKPQVILNHHVLLKPLWDQFKISLIDHKNKFIPESNKFRDNMKLLKHTKSEEIIEFMELLQGGYHPFDEKLYNIRLDFKVSFESDSVFFFKRNINIISTFYTLLSEVKTTSLLSQCGYCEKFIVLTRSDKQYCPGCAAKKNQKEKWEKIPEEMRKKEKQRYQKRKQSN